MPKHHDPEVKAAAMAALLAGQGVCDVAREYALPETTVSRWKAQVRADAGRSDDIGELLLDYLAENLKTLRVQAVAFRDRDWLREQNASEAGILHGILTDKAVRLLEALDGSGVQPAHPHRNGRNRVAGHV